MAHLRAEGWETYHEVEGMSGRYDIVAVFGGRLWIVECKTALCLDLLDQAVEATESAHYVSVAVPAKRLYSRSHNRGRRVATKVLMDYGIGMFEVRDIARVVMQPKLHRESHSAAARLRDRLHPDQMASVPGSCGGGYWTPYRDTMKRIRKIIEENPGIGTSALMRAIGNDHHYASPSSAKSAIPLRLERVEKWCRVELDGRSRRFYIAEGA